MAKYCTHDPGTGSKPLFMVPVNVAISPQHFEVWLPIDVFITFFIYYLKLCKQIFMLLFINFQNYY